MVYSARKDCAANNSLTAFSCWRNQGGGVGRDNDSALDSKDPV